jgi:ElaB/YqjD/DUF883 family membrane-anchored ribosome-binding protein
MSKSPINRLQSLWPTHAADGESAALSGAKQLAARVEPMLENLGHTIAEHPRTSLTFAATCGVLLGWFIKRK